MSEIPARLFRVAKTYLDAAKDRLGEIDARAQEELTKAISRDDIQAGLASPEDPMARAQAKINAARSTGAAGRELSPGGDLAATPSTGPAGPNQTDPIQTAYKILGIPPGSDFLSVQTAANKLRERCSPARFAEGSSEQAEARLILQKVEEAYQMLQAALDPSAGRFDRLEI